MSRKYGSGVGFGFFFFIGPMISNPFLEPLLAWSLPLALAYPMALASLVSSSYLGPSP